MAKSRMTPAQIEELQLQLEENFGAELAQLKAQYELDMKLFGKATALTIRAGNDLRRKILEEKNKDE